MKVSTGPDEKHIFDIAIVLQCVNVRWRCYQVIVAINPCVAWQSVTFALLIPSQLYEQYADQALMMLMNAVNV